MSFNHPPAVARGGGGGGGRTVKYSSSLKKNSELSLLTESGRQAETRVNFPVAFPGIELYAKQMQSQCRVTTGG